MLTPAYVTVEYLTGGDTPPGFIFSTALATLRDARIGAFAVAFPECREGGANGARAPRRPSLGQKLQIFGPTETVAAAIDLLHTFDDYLSIGRLAPTRAARRHASFERVRDADRTAASVARETRRTLRRIADGKREPLLAAEIAERAASTQRSDRPFVTVRSHSNGESFNIGFRMVLRDAAVLGEFDQFGFALNGTTVQLL
jgi:CRISPR-associated endoribonuclease Cas6/Csy4 subtype I-F